MKRARGFLATALAFLLLAFAPGPVPYQAAAAVVGGGAGSVPRVELRGGALAPLFPAVGPVPTVLGLNGGLPASAVAARFFLAGSLPVSGAAQAPAVLAAAAPRGSVDAQRQLGFVGKRLSAAAADGPEKLEVLDSFFSGMRSLAALLDGGVRAACDARSPALSAPLASKIGAASPVSGRRADGRLSWAGWNAPSVKAPAPDDPISWRTFSGLVLQRLPSMSAFMLVAISFFKIARATPGVGEIGYGILMSLSPMAGIAGSMIIGNVIKDKNWSAPQAMAFNVLLRAGALLLLPAFYLFGVVNSVTLTLGGLAEGFLLSSVMNTENSFVKVLFPAKQLNNVNGILFQLFPATQVVLGLIFHIGRYADRVNPFLVFAGAAAVNLFVSLPIVWTMIPHVRLSDSAPAEKAAAPARLLAARAALNKHWREAAWLGAAVALFAAMTWWPPLAATPFLVAHKGLKSAFPIAAALVYWITRTDAYRLLRAGGLAPAIADQDGAARPGLAKNRQLRAVQYMALSTLMYFPLYMIVAPCVAAILAPAHTGAMIGLFLGALFFGGWISTAARTRFSDLRNPFTGGAIRGAHGYLQLGVAALFGEEVFSKLAPGNVAAAFAAFAAAVGLMALSARVTDRGWIKFAGVGFAAVWLPFAVWTWPAALPFLTVKTAMLISLFVVGLVNGPGFVALISYLQRNTASAENSRVIAIQSAISGATISAAYALVTIASSFLEPAYPAVLAGIGILNLFVGSLFWRAPKNLPGLSPTFLVAPKAATSREGPRDR